VTVSALDTPFVVNDTRLAFDAEQHVYRLGDRPLPAVTAILSATGIADFTGPWFTEDIRDRGTYVHQAVALEVEGALDEEALDPALLPYLEGWRAFLAETGCEIEHWERPVCDPVLGYAGTLDGIVRGLTPRRTLIDIKLGLYASAGPQTAAYRRLALNFYAHPVAMDRAVVELVGDGRYRLHPLTYPGDEPLFLAALRIHNWRLAHDARR